MSELVIIINYVIISCIICKFKHNILENLKHKQVITSMLVVSL